MAKMTMEGSYDWDEEDSQKKDSLNLNSLDCWDYTIELECLTGSQDLQLAAELAKNLLARNKELENCVRQCQTTIEEQALEIEFLSKQMSALRKTNDDRIAIYEQLEISIQDLERTNERLALDSSKDKQQIKSLCAYRDSLEESCMELQKALEEARSQRNTQSSQDGDGTDGGSKNTGVSIKDTELLKQNQELKRQKTDLEDKICQLSQDLALAEAENGRLSQDVAMSQSEYNRVVQDMTLMREELTMQYQEQFKNLEEELTEARSGNLCGRCLAEKRVQMIMAVEEDDDEIVVPHGMKMESKDYNPYRTLVEKYEASCEELSRNRRRSQRLSGVNFVSLQDELKPYWDLSSNHGGGDEESGHEDVEKEQKNESGRNTGKRKVSSNTPTDFSEAETFSSGFSDETSNKATQTERNMTPGTFLCTIADGENGILNIYDNGCPIENRFRKTPEYRTLFREIFAVLKRAAEAKDEGEQLPLLDDLIPMGEVPKVPPVTPAREDAPAGFDDVQSLPDSVATEEEKPADPSTEIKSLSLGLTVKSQRKSNNSPGRRKGGERAVEEGEGTPRNSPRRGGRRRKDRKNYDSPRTQSPAMKTHVLTTVQRPTSSGSPGRGKDPCEFKPFLSTAAKEIAKLKHLEKSYAEVLRTPPPGKFSCYSLTKC